MGLTQADIYELLEDSDTIYLRGINSSGGLTRFAVDFNQRRLLFLTNDVSFSFLDRVEASLPKFAGQYKYCITISGLSTIGSTFRNVEIDSPPTLFDLV